MSKKAKIITFCFLLFILCLYIFVLINKVVVSQAGKIRLRVVTPKECIICNTEGVVQFLSREFPGLAVSYLYYPDRESKRMIKDFNIQGLPAYFLGKEIEKENIPENLKTNLEKKGNFYMLSPRFSGISYMLEREETKDRLDLFISLYDKNAAALLEVIKEFNPIIHFLASQQQDSFSAIHGQSEVEEYLHAVCVKKYFPDKFWNYTACRVRNIENSWLDTCASDLDLDKIKLCANGEEGVLLLRENTSLNKELKIMFGPTFLLDNYLIFGTKGVLSKEELSKIIKR